PVGYRHAAIAHNPHYDFPQAVALVLHLEAIQHLAEDYPAHRVKLAGQLQLHKDAINPVRLFAQVLQEEDPVISTEFIGRAERGGQDGETSAVESALR